MLYLHQLYFKKTCLTIVIKYPLIYSGLYVFYRYIKIFILYLIFIGINASKKTDLNILYIYSILYSKPLEYMYAIFNNSGINVNFQQSTITEKNVHIRKIMDRCRKTAKTIRNSELPSGMPWNIMFIDEIKALIQIICNL